MNKYLILLVFFISLYHGSTECFAFAPKKLKEEAPIPIKQAMPTRHVFLKNVAAPPFTFPNGAKIDLNMDLNAIALSQVNQSNHIRSTQQSDSCLVMAGAITSLEMDILELGIQFGWNRNGIIPIPGTPGLEGKLTIRLSNMSMDFHIYDQCQNFRH